MEYRFRILNVFANQRLGGNPLCVFEDGRGLSDEDMQALALQFNLSETVFILPSDQANARMRIFTTGYEMPFAGHPTLGTAHVVRSLQQTGERLRLECKAGIVEVSAQGDVWTLKAPAERVHTHPCVLSREDIAQMLGLDVLDLLDEPLWVDTGTDQLCIPLRSHEAVDRASPNASLLHQWPMSSLARKTAYIFAWDDATQSASGRLAFKSRYFFTKQGGGIEEDPGTGSACANLGGWWITKNYPLPLSAEVAQGDHVKRPCQLLLDVGLDAAIRVGGRVMTLGAGVIEL